MSQPHPSDGEERRAVPPPSPRSPQAGTGGPTGRDRRRWPRAGADWPVSIGLPDGRFEARVRDVSQAGVCFYLDRPVAVMTVLGVELELSVPAGRRRVKARGVVVRCERISERIDHYEIAVYLDDLAQPDREVLTSYVSSRRLGGAGSDRALSAGD